MVDPRLNSVHLEMPRRQEFRRARQAVLRARGWMTLAAEEDLPEQDSDSSQQTGMAAPEVSQLWLVDHNNVYPLRVGLNTLGRASDNDIVIADGYISRRHCAILVHADRLVELFDTASKNGVLINGHHMTGS